MDGYQCRRAGSHYCDQWLFGLLYGLPCDIVSKLILTQASALSLPLSFRAKLRFLPQPDREATKSQQIFTASYSLDPFLPSELQQASILQHRMSRAREMARATPPADAVAQTDSAPPPIADGPDEAAAESDDSTTTREITVDDAWSALRECRARKVEMGGILSRPVKEYRREDSRLAPFYTPRADADGVVPSPREHTEEDHYNSYVGTEAHYFEGEMVAWEVFLVLKQRAWAKRNAAAGGTLPRLPPVADMDQLELCTEYLECVRERVRERKNDTEYRYPPPGWVFMEECVLDEHLADVEKQVATMRKERGLPAEASSEQPQAQSDAVEQTRGKRKSAGDDLTEAGSKSQPQKRARLEPPGELKQARATRPPSSRKRQKSAPAVKEKTSKPGVAVDAEISAANITAEKRPAKKSGTTRKKGKPDNTTGSVATAPRGPDMPTSGKTSSSAKKQKKMTATLPVQGVRRSARIARRAAKG